MNDKKQKTYLERFKKTIEKLEDVNDNFHIGGQQYGRIDEVIDELKALYEGAKVFEELSKHVCDMFDRVNKETYTDLNKNFVH